MCYVSVCLVSRMMLALDERLGLLPCALHVRWHGVHCRDANTIDDNNNITIVVILTICVYIYIYRERERYMCIYIYIYTCIIAKMTQDDRCSMAVLAESMITAGFKH